MKAYIGTKIIRARPLTKNEAEGYEVRYPDGYTSWSPKDVFEVPGNQHKRERLA